MRARVKTHQPHPLLCRVNQEEQVFTPDEIWEQMIRQAWLDIVQTINRDKALHGINLRPLLLDPLLGVPISISEDMAGYHVDLAMWNISVGGLDNLRLEELTLERGEALNNLREQSIIDIGNLTVEGMYQYTAQEGIQLNDRAFPISSSILLFTAKTFVFH